MKDVDRHGVLIRTIKILRLIADNRFGVTIQDIQEEIHISKRAIYRYLSSFKRAGIRVGQSGGGGGHMKKWRLLDQREHLARIGII